MPGAGGLRKELVAEIAINSTAKSVGKVIELDMSYSEIRNILRSF
jgi:hypothetical protein